MNKSPNQKTREPPSRQPSAGPQRQGHRGPILDLGGSYRWLTQFLGGDAIGRIKDENVLILQKQRETF